MNELEELILCAKNNDHNAFESIVRKFQDMAIGYAYSVVRNFDTPKDVVQEAFIQAYLDLDKLHQDISANHQNNYLTAVLIALLLLMTRKRN